PPAPGYSRRWSTSGTATAAGSASLRSAPAAARATRCSWKCDRPGLARSLARANQLEGSAQGGKLRAVFLAVRRLLHADHVPERSDEHRLFGPEGDEHRSSARV